MVVISAFIGILMITMGRQLYWLFVGGIGFVYGIFLATQLYSGQSDWVMLFIAMLVGIAGALFAYSLQFVAVAAAGFLTGGYLIYTLLLTLGIGYDLQFQILVGAGGVIGVIMVLLSMDWALIILSSLTGAALTIQTTNYNQATSAILFFSLAILGIIIQTIRWKQEPVGI